MTSNDEKELQILTKKPLSEQNRLLKLFAKLNLSQKKEIVAKQRSIFHTFKDTKGKEFNNETLTLASQIIAIERYENTLNEHELKVIKYKEKKANKNNKTGKLLVIWAIVQDLKINKEMSFREIADYLTDSKFEVSYSLVYREWQKYEGKVNL